MKLFLLLAAITANLALLDAAAESCDEAACQLPACLCASESPPENLLPGDIPQMVMLTFDDAISTSNFDYYEELLFPRQNPNGCPISATFYTTHEYNDYSLVNEMHRMGHEIALHSITHTTDPAYWKDASVDLWTDEIMGLAEITETFGLIPAEDMTGMRAPFLQPGTHQYEMIQAANLTYDCSLPSRTFMVTGLFPYTLDYLSGQDCVIEPCPTDSYPGLWEAPMIQLEGVNGYPCSMYDTCLGANTSTQVVDNLKMNFHRHYDGSRSPFGIFIHSSWFDTQTFHKPGYTEFLDYLSGLGDVYIVSVSQVIDWMKDPTPTANLDSFSPWGCPASPPDSNCPNPVSCHYTEPEDHYMMSCVSCPPNYPWLGNPSGQ